MEDIKIKKIKKILFLILVIISPPIFIIVYYIVGTVGDVNTDDLSVVLIRFAIFVQLITFGYYLFIKIFETKQNGKYYQLIHMLLIITLSIFILLFNIGKNKNSIIENQLQQNKALFQKIDTGKVLQNDIIKIDSCIIDINNVLELSDYEKRVEVFNSTKEIYNEIIIKNKKTLKEDKLITFSSEQIGSLSYMLENIRKHKLVFILVILLLIVSIIIILFTPRKRSNDDWWRLDNNSKSRNIKSEPLDFDESTRRLQ